MTPITSADDDEVPDLLDVLQPGGLFHAGQHVPRAYLLSCLDPSLSPHLHNLGVCVNGKDGVAIALVVHERTHRVDHDHRTFLIDLTEAHTIASLESTIERRGNWEVELVQLFKIFFKKKYKLY